MVNVYACTFCITLINLLFNFLQVVTDILYLQGQKLTAYKGDYDTFERTRAEQMKNQQKAFEANERSREHMQVFFVALLLQDEAACCFCCI